MSALTPEQRAAADVLIRQEWNRIERFLRTKIPAGDIPDVAQAVFVGYVNRFSEVRSDHRAYLWQIARNQVLKYFEKHRGRSSTAFDSTKHTVSEVGPSLSSVVDRRNRFVRAMQRLPADQHIAVEFRFGEGLSLDETATALGVSLATAKRYLKAAQETLRAELGVDMDAVGAAYRG